MPSIRKRIGYLPSINAQETITKIANEEKLSQSKVVGILVEEALVARCRCDLQSANYRIRKNHHENPNNIYDSSFNYNDLDELISDKGITYNYKSEVDSYEPKKKFNQELFEQFEQFEQFILLKKMAQDK